MFIIVISTEQYHYPSLQACVIIWIFYSLHGWNLSILFSSWWFAYSISFSHWKVHTIINLLFPEIFTASNSEHRLHCFPTVVKRFSSYVSFASCVSFIPPFCFLLASSFFFLSAELWYYAYIVFVSNSTIFWIRMLSNINLFRMDTGWAQKKKMSHDTLCVWNLKALNSVEDGVWMWKTVAPTQNLFMT